MAPLFGPHASYVTEMRSIFLDMKFARELACESLQTFVEEVTDLATCWKNSRLMPCFKPAAFHISSPILAVSYL